MKTTAYYIAQEYYEIIKPQKNSLLEVRNLKNLRGFNAQSLPFTFGLTLTTFVLCEFGFGLQPVLAAPSQKSLVVTTTPTPADRQSQIIIRTPQLQSEVRIPLTNGLGRVNPPRSLRVTRRPLACQELPCIKIPDHITQISFGIPNITEVRSVNLANSSALIGRTSLLLQQNEQQNENLYVKVSRLLNLVSNSVVECYSDSGVNETLDCSLRRALVFLSSFKEVRDVYQSNMNALAYDLMLFISRWENVLEGFETKLVVTTAHAAPEYALVVELDPIETMTVNSNGKRVDRLKYLVEDFRETEADRTFFLGENPSRRARESFARIERHFIRAIQEGEKLDIQEHYLESDLEKDFEKLLEDGILSTLLCRKYLTFCHALNKLESNPNTVAKLIRDKNLQHQGSEDELSLASLLKIYTPPEVIAVEAPSING